MTMTTEELKGLVETAVVGRFPGVTIRFESLLENADHIGVGVYCVEEADVELVEELVFSLDWELASKSGFALSPLVVNRAKTKQFYPEMIPQWERAATAYLQELEVSGGISMLCSNEVESASAADWLGGDANHLAMNEEFALAA